MNELNTNMEKKINELLEKKIKDLGIKNKEKEKILEKIDNKEKNEKINSSIIKTSNNADFVEKIIKENVLNKNMQFKLLYRASKDGDDCKIFHEKCNNNKQILVIYKTKKGIIFGGYTETGFNGGGGMVYDNKSFVFSCNKKKIYKVKHCYPAIFDGNNNGPTFGYDIGFYSSIINVKDKMLNFQCSTADIKKSTFEGLDIDYELNNGEKYFYLQDIEVFKIIFE